MGVVIFNWNSFVQNLGNVPSMQSGLDAAKGAANATRNGQVYIATDTQIIYQVVAGTWEIIASSTTAVTAGNGLTLNGSEIDLGGNLSQNTTIQLSDNVGDNYYLRFVGPNPVPSTGPYVIFSNTETGMLIQDTAGIDEAGFDANLSAGSPQYGNTTNFLLYKPGASFYTQMTITRNPVNLLLRGIIFQDDIFSIGPRAAADYSANWTSLSYVTLGYLQTNYAAKTTTPGNVVQNKITGQTTNQTAFTYASAPGGLYRINIATIVSSFTSGNVTFNLNFTDQNSNAKTFGLDTISAIGTDAVTVRSFYPKAGTNITLTCVVTGTLTYSVWFTLEYLANI